MLLLALILIFCANAFCQQTDPGSGPAAEAATPAGTPAKPILPTLLQSITVTATREPEELKSVPQAVTMLTPEAIETRSAETPNEMLTSEPGIWSVRVAAQGSPIVRGQIGNRILYLWDGIRINNGALFSGPNGFFNQIPPNAIDHMEVLRGPGAVQYGSDAIGGVVNIFTRRVDYNDPAPHFGGDISARYGTVDGEKSSMANFWFVNRRFSFTGGATGQMVDDYRAPGIGIIPSTGFDAAGGSMSLGYRLAAGQTLRLSWIHDRRFDVATYTQSKMNASGIPRIVGPFEQRGLLRLSHEVDHLGRLSSGLNSYLYYQYYDAIRDTTVETTTLLNRTRQNTGQRMYGGGVQNSNLISKLRLVYGFDYRAEDLNSDKALFATTKTTGSVLTSIPNGNIPPGGYNVTDGFALATLRPTARLTLSLGARFESAVLESHPRPQDALSPFTVDSLRLHKRWNSLTWSTGAVYDAGSGISLVTSIAAGFRAPTFSDTLSTGVPVYASGVASVPSTQIQPERSITYDLGLRHVSRNVHVSLTAYSTELTDVLYSSPAGTIDIPGVGVVQAMANHNISSAHVRGVEGAFTWHLHGPWTLLANATYTRGQDTYRNVPLRFIPPLNGTAGVRWEKPDSRWWVDTSVLLADRLRRHAPEDEIDAGFSRDPGYGSPSATNPPLRPDFSIPGFAVANVRVGFTVWRESARKLELFTSVNNLFNLRYREAYSQQELLAPGTGAVLGGRLRF
jgi:hemoglobin/transferrin/lactoferrin receptor protein